LCFLTKNNIEKVPVIAVMLASVKKSQMAILALCLEMFEPEHKK
jgi:hypothetical protein